MSLVSTTIPNLVNGISQQPYALRLASQAQSQVNGYSSVVEGLRKRPGSQHIRRLPSFASNVALHIINRDSFEQYLVAVTNGNLRVFDIEGNEKTVNFPNGKTYLSSTAPNKDMRFVTVADFTFVLNTQRVVEEATNTIAARPYEALVWVKQGAYGAKYTLNVAGQTHTFTTPNGDQPTHATAITTDNIAEQLRSGIVTKLGTGWTVTRYGSTLYIRRTDAASFTISVDDSIGDSGVTVFVQKVQRFSELPARAVNGFTIEVVGDQTSSFDNYYVRYETDGTATSGGVWKETAKGGERDRMNAATMPHALVREADGTFTFKRLDWDVRKVGDLDSNPFPSFVGRKINDIFFHRDRLGFISDENVVFSRTGSYFNFFRGTATQVLDDDPIDVGVSHTKVSILRHAIPFNETLLLFSDKTQFQLGSADVLAPDTVSINQTTEYECSLDAKPVGAGRYVYFAVNRGTYTGIREYYVDGATESNDAQEITGHVPKYIPGGVYKLAASGNEDVIVALTERSPNRVYIYRYHWAGNEKLQASWSHWEFHPNDIIRNCAFIESKLYVVIQRADGLHLEMIDLEPGKVEDNWHIAVHLDSRVKSQNLTMVLNENDPDLFDDDTTSITLPYKLRSGEKVELVTLPGGARAEGVVVKEYALDNSGSTSVITIPGDWRNQPFQIGRPYEFRYRFSTFVIKEESVGGGEMTVGEGRIQLRKMSVLYADTSFFRAEVTPFRRDTYVYTFSGRVVGSGRNLVGRVSTETGKYQFPLMTNNNEIVVELVNDTFLPCFFLSAEWEGFYTIRSRRL